MKTNMLKIIIRSIIGVVIGIALYTWIAESAPQDTGYLVLWIAWGIGMANAMTPSIRIIRNALSWAANLSILTFFSFGNGLVGIIVFIIVLSVVLSIGWIGGWFVLIRDVISELR